MLCLQRLLFVPATRSSRSRRGPNARSRRREPRRAAWRGYGSARKTGSEWKPQGRRVSRTSLDEFAARWLSPSEDRPADFQIRTLPAAHASGLSLLRRLYCWIWRHALSMSMTHSLRAWLAQPLTQKRLWYAFISNAVFLLLISAAAAQTTSSISGTVRDTSDALVPGADGR